MIEWQTKKSWKLFRHKWKPSAQKLCENIPEGKELDATYQGWTFCGQQPVFFKQSFFTFIERYSTKKILWEKIKKHIFVLLQHGVTQNITINPHRWWRSAKKWKMEFWMRWKELIRQWWTNYFTKKYCN